MIAQSGELEPHFALGHVAVGRVAPEVELGKGSFTAEQHITIVKLFNVPLSHFAPMPVPVGDDLHNTLANFGPS